MGSPPGSCTACLYPSGWGQRDLANERISELSIKGLVEEGNDFPICRNNINKGPRSSISLVCRGSQVVWSCQRISGAQLEPKLLSRRRGVDASDGRLGGSA